MTQEPRFDLPRPIDVLSPADAAALSKRSLSTIRRAYLSGALRAFRDGNGRGVSIRRGDLEAWLTSETAATPQSRPSPTPRPREPGQASRRGLASSNREILAAARAAARSPPRAG